MTKTLGVVAFGGAATALLAAVLGASPLLAQPSTHPGRQVYIDAVCANCHGNRGQGGISIDFPKGPSLRTTQLDRETMTMVIECGIPGTRMPAWLKGAYTEVECYGEPVGQAPSGMIVPGALTKEQIADLVDYIFDEFVQTPQS